MKFSIALLSFAALALGQVTRGPDTDPNSLIATATETYDHEGPTQSSAPSTSASVEQWPQYSKASTTAAPSEGLSSAQPDSPFTFGDGASGSPPATGWSGSAAATPSVWTTSVKSSAKSTGAAALTTSAAATTHATGYSTTAKASSSTKASSSAQAAYTGAAMVGKEVALGFGAVAAGLALVF